MTRAIWFCSELAWPRVRTTVLYEYEVNFVSYFFTVLAASELSGVGGVGE